jgi:hypothetical protein
VARSVDIDTQGRLAAGEDARRALADRAGRFVLLPSSPDLLVLARTPPLGVPAPPPRCVLAGDVSAFPIADFLAFIDTTRLSGLLTVASGGVERTLAFRSGEVRGATSQAAAERIGEVALRLGYVTRGQLESVKSSGRKFGQALVERGWLSAADLSRCFREQVTAVFHAILVSQQGVFWLVDQPEPDLGEPLSLSTQSLLMDGIRRIDEMSLFVSRIPGPGAVIGRREPPRTVELEPEELAALELVDGRRTVAEIAQAGRASEFDAMKVLYHLAEAGYVEARAASADHAPAGDAARAELARGFAAALRHVVQVAGDHGAREALVAGLRAQLGATHGRFAPLFARVALAEDGALDGAALLGNLALVRPAALRRLEPSGDATRYLRDGLRELLFFALFQLGERVPREVDDALAADVKNRLAALGGLA